MRYLAGFGVGVCYGVHASNIVNLARGITERVLYVVRDGALARAPQPKRGVFSRLTKVRSLLLSHLRPTPVVAPDDYPDLYTGRKQGIYRRAAESLKTRSVQLRDAWVNTFVKAEKVNLSKKGDPAPRVIQPRNPRYTLMVGRYLKRFEGQLCYGFRKAFGYPVILKGMNADAVGEQLAENWAQFDEPVGVGLDATRFDQHVSREALMFEHGVYNAVFRSAELAELLSWQLTNHGRARATDGTISYTVDGCRMSGDINTGMGNCLIMSLIVLAYCHEHGVRVRLANNGDDCVIVCEKGDLPRLAGLDSWFLDFGFTLTREDPVYVLEKVEFCQAQPVRIGGSWRMVRNPLVAMSKDCVSLLGWDSDVQFEQWAGAIGSCGLSLTQGVPVWQHWYSRLVGIGRQNMAVTEVVCDSGLGYMARGVRQAVIDEDARYSFYLAFGILPDLQRALEAEYSLPVEIMPGDRMTFPDVKILDSDNNSLARWLVAGGPQTAA